MFLLQKSSLAPSASKKLQKAIQLSLSIHSANQLSLSIHSANQNLLWSTWVSLYILCVLTHGFTTNNTLARCPNPTPGEKTTNKDISERPAHLGRATRQQAVTDVNHVISEGVLPPARHAGLALWRGRERQRKKERKRHRERERERERGTVWELGLWWVMWLKVLRGVGVLVPSSWR